MARPTQRMEQGEPAMSDEEIRAILERLCDSHKLPYKSGTLDVWHHFDSEETRMRGDPGSATVRVSEKHLLHLVNEQGGAVTDERIKLQQRVLDSDGPRPLAVKRSFWQ